MRFGATLAALAVASSAAVRRLILWSPILHGAAYAQELLRVNLAMQLAQYKPVRHDRDALVQAMCEGRSTKVDGNEISHAMYEEISESIFGRYPQGRAITSVEEPIWKKIKPLHVHAKRRPGGSAQSAQSRNALAEGAFRGSVRWRRWRRGRGA